MKVKFKFSFALLFLTLFVENLNASTFLEYITSQVYDPGRAAILSKSATYEFPADKPIALGYIALCSGTSALANAVELGTLSKWAHVAMVFCPPKDVSSEPVDCRQIQNMCKKDWLFFETTDLGTCLVPFDAFKQIESSCSIFLRPFIYDADVHGCKKPKLSRSELKKITEHIGKPYEKFMDEFLLAAVGKNTTEQTDTLFCSESMALILQDVGMLSKEKLADNYIPADFSTERPGALNLIGAELGPEIIIQKVERGIFGKSFDMFIGMLRGIKQYFW